MTYRNVLLAALLMACASSAAEARERRWCENIRGFEGAGTQICVYDSLEACVEEARGGGGYCGPNPYFTGANVGERSPAHTPPRPAPRRKPQS